MSKKITHKGHYISLFLIFGFGLLGISLAYSSKKLQAEILILTAVFYVIWGILHHRVNHRLNSKIVIEYILIAALGITALMFFLNGAFGI